jgi:hypothetical protein
MNHKDSTAIENLMMVARYMQDNSILSTRDEKLLELSISRCESLINKKIPPHGEDIELCNADDFNLDAYIEAIKKRKKS